MANWGRSGQGRITAGGHPALGSATTAAIRPWLDLASSISREHSPDQQRIAPSPAHADRVLEFATEPTGAR
jgi:hypothetical protein